MADAIPHSMSMHTMGKLFRLAEQRASYFVELKTSGRWKHYYPSQEKLEAHLQEAADLAACWRRAIDTARAADEALQKTMPMHLPSFVPLFARAS